MVQIGCCCCLGLLMGLLLAAWLLLLKIKSVAVCCAWAAILKLRKLYGTFGMQRLIFSAKYRLLVRGGCSRPKIRSGFRIRAQKQAESSG